MTSSAISSANRSGRSAASPLSFILNLLGVIAGSALALTSLIGWGSPIGFFSGLAAAFYCLDGVR